jgi:hypothetical protein
MNVGNGTVAAQFLSWEYLFEIFFIVSLQCGTTSLYKTLVFTDAYALQSLNI